MYYQKSITQVQKDLHTQKQGLQTKEAQKRLKKNGPNIFAKQKRHQSAVSIFFTQWKNPLIIILVVATVVSGLLHEFIDMTVIALTTLINVGIGFFQEYKASTALEKLSQMVSYKAIILRDNAKQQIDSKHLVPGDILFLEAGDKIQADGRIIEAIEFTINESALTGESEPVVKITKAIKGQKRLGDRKNMVYAGTVVTEGKATIIITNTGTNTEIGQIASLVEKTKDDPTPLQAQLNSLAKKISFIVILICMGIFAIGTIFGHGAYTTFELFETAIAVAVAAIPEGLAISLTVILAIGMQFVLKRNALVRKLVAAETLGSVSVICTDKTGTLTVGDMRVTHIISATKSFDYSEGTKHQDQHSITNIISAAVLCSNASIQDKQKPEAEWKYIGDTTEIALIRAGANEELFAENLNKKTPRIAEIPFDSTKKFMATLNKGKAKNMLHIKGAFDVLLPKVSHYIDEKGTKKAITPKQKQWFITEHDKLTANGLRVLAIAQKETTKTNITESDVDGITIIGLVGMEDPLRADVIDTMKVAQSAGIKVIMVTGDYAATATSIGKQLGLKGSVIDGNTLETLTDAELKKHMKTTSIFARVDPKHKIRIVQALQSQNHVVAMTGDGVNDAPAIKAADIGIAVGTGTDVAKETADMVILDDRFTTIVNAVEEGRGLYENIKKVVLYLLSGSFSEVVMVTGSIVAGLPVAALPAQILWVNVIEDAFPTMALAFDPPSKENMKDKPRKKGQSIIDTEMRTMMILKSVLANIALFGIFLYFLKTTGDIKLTRTLVFVGFGIDALFFIFSIRNLRRMIWQIPLFNNLYLIAAVAFGWMALLLAIYWPPLQLLLQTEPLTVFHWAVMISFGIFNLCLMETVKWFFIVRHKHQKT